MKSLSQIRADIRKLVNDTVRAGAIGHVQFYTRQIMEANGAIEGDDVAFYTVCTEDTVRRMVKQAVDKYDKPDADTPILAGFEHMREAYTVHRDGEHLLVPIQLCTDAELIARADEYDSAALGYMKHGEELRDYVSQRKAKATQ